MWPSLGSEDSTCSWHGLFPGLGTCPCDCVRPLRVCDSTWTTLLLGHLGGLRHSVTPSPFLTCSTACSLSNVQHLTKHLLLSARTPAHIPSFDSFHNNKQILKDKGQITQDILGCWERGPGSIEPRDLKKIVEIKIKTKKSHCLGKWLM